MATSTAQILNGLHTAKAELPEAIKAIKGAAIPAAEIGGEVLTHVGIGALAGVTGLPLQKFGMFAAPVAGKLVGAATGLALDGVEKLGSTIIDGTARIVEAADKSMHHQPKLITPLKVTPR